MTEMERLHDEIRSLRVEVSGLRIEREGLLRALNHEERSRLGYHGPDCAIQRHAPCDCETQQYHQAVGTANILRRMWQELAEALGTDEEHVAMVARDLASRPVTPSAPDSAPTADLGAPEGPATAPGAGDPEPEIEQALADYSVIAAPNPSEARGFRVGYRAALGRRPPAAGSRPFDKIGADRLADEVAVLVRRGVIDSRSPAADALLDYRNPPSSPRADRLAALEEASAAPPAAGSREATREHNPRKSRHRTEAVEIASLDCGCEEPRSHWEPSRPGVPFDYDEAHRLDVLQTALAGLRHLAPGPDGDCWGQMECWGWADPPRHSQACLRARAALAPAPEPRPQEGPTPA